MRFLITLLFADAVATGVRVIVETSPRKYNLWFFSETTDNIDIKRNMLYGTLEGDPGSNNANQIGRLPTSYNPKKQSLWKSQRSLLKIKISIP